MNANNLLFFAMASLLRASVSAVSNDIYSSPVHTHPYRRNMIQRQQQQHLVSEPYCGFISEDQWKLPLNYCSLTATNERECTDEHFFGVFSCFWKDNECRSTHSSEGQECGQLGNKASCEASPEFVAFDSCQWLEPDASTQLSIPSYCGNPGLDDPWLMPQSACSMTARNREECERSSLVVAQSCSWGTNGCHGPSRSGESYCKTFPSERSCNIGSYIEFAHCAWYEYESPSIVPSLSQSSSPSFSASMVPSVVPSGVPTDVSSVVPSSTPSDRPSVVPSIVPSIVPSVAPSTTPSIVPSLMPSAHPTAMAVESIEVRRTPVPTREPSPLPSPLPTRSPTLFPTQPPTPSPTRARTVLPTISSTVPSRMSSSTPTMSPSVLHSTIPTTSPSVDPSGLPSTSPTAAPSMTPSSNQPSVTPTSSPSRMPSGRPTAVPTSVPSSRPSVSPSSSPTFGPTRGNAYDERLNGNKGFDDDDGVNVEGLAAVAAGVVGISTACALCCKFVCCCRCCKKKEEVVDGDAHWYGSAFENVP